MAEEGEEKRNCFSRARLRHSNHVATRHNSRNCLGLDRCGSHIVEPFNDIKADKKDMSLQYGAENEDTLTNWQEDQSDSTL